jgi:hypothetical protein
MRDSISLPISYFSSEVLCSDKSLHLPDLYGPAEVKNVSRIRRDLTNDANMLAGHTIPQVCARATSLA